MVGHSLFQDVRRRCDETLLFGAGASRHLERLTVSASQHLAAVTRDHGQRFRDVVAALGELASDLAGREALFDELCQYMVDATQRAVLTFDTLRERGNLFNAHEAAGAPPVLVYDYEIVTDGRSLSRPVNYMLLALAPAAGAACNPAKQPFMIIDPRAGHGAGIGGFKLDSQVGVAMRHGHPVYFVAFRPEPEPSQTLADVMRAEAAFVREISRRHPQAGKPVVVGNCQGGWAALLLAAANPDLTGPVVVNGAPVATWSGRSGTSPMRYNGGLLGGALPAVALSDLGGGRFDGANLVLNFEMLNPGRNWFRKYYDLFRDVDTARERFLEFEKWWGGFYLFNEPEIRWTIEQLFVGNRVSRGEARLERGRHLDLKAIRAPIIVFASRGDDITAPEQALNWIADTYADENEIKIRGQRILYMLHDKVGHLGIFVSSAIARKEHAEVATTLATIESLPPGLYEMTIDEEIGGGIDTHFHVSFHDRRLADIVGLTEGREDEDDFGAVARLSELAVETYDLFARPLVKALAMSPIADATRVLHPLRMQRWVVSDLNPAVAMTAPFARAVAAERRSAAGGNPFLTAEALVADMVEQGFDLARDLRNAWWELAFFALYGSPWMRWIGQTHNFRRVHESDEELRNLPEVRAALMNLGRGGLPEAIIRMLIVVAGAHGSVPRSRLARFHYVVSRAEPFLSLGPELRARLLHEQSLIVEFEREAAIEALALLLSEQEDRVNAVELVEYLAGPLEQMDGHSIQALQRFRRVFDLPPIGQDLAAPDLVPSADGQDAG
jgi:pimeloyl-ACP methyl ester carboxylesterase